MTPINTTRLHGFLRLRDNPSFFLSFRGCHHLSCHSAVAVFQRFCAYAGATSRKTQEWNMQNAFSPCNDLTERLPSKGDPSCSVVYLQLGHGPSAFGDPNYRRLVPLGRECLEMASSLSSTEKEPSPP